MLLGLEGKKAKRWTKVDYMLAMAVDRLDREKCSKCGHPAWIAYNDDNNIQFEIEEIECYACEALESHEHRRKDKDKKPGVTEVAVPIHVMWEFEKDGEKSPLPDRESYIQREADKARKLAELKKSE